MWSIFKASKRTKRTNIFPILEISNWCGHIWHVLLCCYHYFCDLHLFSWLFWPIVCICAVRICVSKLKLAHQVTTFQKIFQICFCCKQKSSLPWNQYTILGYFGELSFSFASGVAYLIVFGSMVLLFVGIVLHFKAFFKIYKHLFSQLNTSNENHTNSILLCKLIKLNISAKE